MSSSSGGAWWRNRRVLVAAVAAVVIGVAFVLTYFEPQAVFLDDRVDEAFPSAAAEPDDELPAADDTDEEPAADTSPAEGVTPPAGPVALAAGAFEGRSRYSARGTATVFETDGQRVLRFEDFEADNGPDLVVWLATAGAEASDDELQAEFVELGELKGNIGAQNYELPDEVDIDEYASVVIWCRRFSVGFATAGLT